MFNTISKEEAFIRSLPKWPQMLVTGKPITIEQAKEIIFATDNSLTSTSGLMGNDRDFSDWFMELTGYNKLVGRYVDLYPNNFSTLSDAEKDSLMSKRLIFRNAETEFLSRANFLINTYVCNSWVSCAFIGGPHGWCHPNGTISFIDNVGKWPSVQEIFDEWQTIATRWPFLDVHVTLMNGESQEDNILPVINFHICNGEIFCFNGDTTVHSGKRLKRSNADLYAKFDHMRNDLYSFEQGLPQSWIDEFINKISPIVNDVCVAHQL